MLVTTLSTYFCLYNCAKKEDKEKKMPNREERGKRKNMQPD